MTHHSSLRYGGGRAFCDNGSCARSGPVRVSYFDPATGISRRWSQKIDGHWYYFNTDSVMQKNRWITWQDGRKSYFNWDGRALTGWRSFNGIKYYLDPVTGMTPW